MSQPITESQIQGKRFDTYERAYQFAIRFAEISLTPVAIINFEDLWVVTNKMVTSPFYNSRSLSQPTARAVQAKRNKPRPKLGKKRKALGSPKGPVYDTSRFGQICSSCSGYGRNPEVCLRCLGSGWEQTKGSNSIL